MVYVKYIQKKQHGLIHFLCATLCLVLFSCQSKNQTSDLTAAEIKVPDLAGSRLKAKSKKPHISSQTTATGVQAVQRSEAEAKQSKSSMALNLPESDLNMEFVQVPTGQFLPGIAEEEFSEILKHFGTFSITMDASIRKKQEEVHFAESFYIGTFEVTQSQYADFNESYLFKDAEAEHPVHGLSLEEINAFLEWFNAEHAHFELRLPTELEWEYAARGIAEFNLMLGQIPTKKQANFRLDAVAPPELKNVGSYKRTSWVGAYDMEGNVSEICTIVKGVYKMGVRYETSIAKGGSVFTKYPVYLMPFSRYPIFSSKGDEDKGFRVVAIPK